jgi:acyl dehydratase
MSSEAALTLLQSKLGQELHVSDWLEITQERINDFARATDDHQWIHTDPERAAKESPWRSTIAHGYLTMSLYPMLRGIVDAEKQMIPGVKTVVNYGLNKLRFTNAIKTGSRVRGHAVLTAVEEIKGAVQITEEFTVEIEGQSKPAAIAEVIMRLYF